MIESLTVNSQTQKGFARMLHARKLEPVEELSDVELKLRELEQLLKPPDLSDLDAACAHARAARSSAAAAVTAAERAVAAAWREHGERTRFAEHGELANARKVLARA